MAPVGTRQNIVVIDVATNKATVVTRVTARDVWGFQWTTNDRLLFFMDDDGNESFGVWAVNKDGSKLNTLVPAATGRIKTTNVLNVLEEDDDWVLVSNNDRRPAYPDLFRLNIYSGRKIPLLRNPGKQENRYDFYGTMETFLAKNLNP